MLPFGKLLSKEDFDEICRCCLSPGLLGGIFEVLYEEIPLVNIFYNLFGAQFNPNDDLPKKICENCIGDVVRCYIFKMRYEASEAALRNIAITIDVAIKPEPHKDNFEELEETLQVEEKIIVDSNENETSDTTIANQEQNVNITKLKESIFTCTCEKSFTSKLKFHQHQKLTKHHLPRDHSCTICGKVFTKLGLRAHTKTHGPKRHYCDHCKRTFATNRNLQRHNMVIHKGKRPAKDHSEELKVTHQVDEKNIRDPNANETCNNTENNLKKKGRIIKQSTIYTCSCEETFTSKLKFQQHRELTKHDMRPCKICGKLFPKHALGRHTKRHEAIKRHHCDRCEKRFASKTGLEIHIRRHTGERPCVCEFCNKSFIQRYTLTMHRRIHTGEKPFLCTFCGKRFAKKVNCDVHMLTHNGQKSQKTSSNSTRKYICDKCGSYYHSRTAFKHHLYKHGLSKEQIIEDGERQCKICKKFFISENTLSIHMKIHSAEKRFLCNVCGKKFHLKTGLDSHSLVHSGEKSFACEFCHKKFARQLGLQLHRFTHTGEKPYACPQCPKKFIQNARLNIHLKIHTGEKPHVCTFCDKAFPRKDTLKTHVRVHTGEKPYKCDVCTNAFSDTRCLNRHKQRMHQQV